MIDFKTQYTARETGEVWTSEPGLPYLVEYEYKVKKDDSGNEVRTLVKTDCVTNVHDRIQADYPSTDINLLMKRFALGDTSALDVTKGMYFDATSMPKTYAELFDRSIQAEQYFEQLPTDVKEMFANSPETFFSQFGSDEFWKKINEYNDRFVDHSFDDDAAAGSPKQNVEGKEIEY